MQQPPNYPYQPFGPPPYRPLSPQQQPKRSRRRLWLILSITAGIIILSCVTCGIIGARTSPPQTAAVPTPTIQATQLISQAATVATGRTLTDTPTITLRTPTTTARATPTPTPMPVQATQPTPTSIPTPRPQPTQRPTPTPTPCVAVNNNPWCFNFSTPGNLIYYPPNGFCGYFNCIATFYASDDPGDGYIIECQDGTYSQSGGESGACSSHGGEMRALYSH